MIHSPMMSHNGMIVMAMVSATIKPALTMTGASMFQGLKMALTAPGAQLSAPMIVMAMEFSML